MQRLKRLKYFKKGKFYDISNALYILVFLFIWPDHQYLLRTNNQELGTFDKFINFSTTIWFCWLFLKFWTLVSKNMLVKVLDNSTIPHNTCHFNLFLHVRKIYLYMEDRRKLNVIKDALNFTYTRIHFLKVNLFFFVLTPGV